MSFNDEDQKNVTSNLRPGDEVEIFVAFEHGLIVKETAVYLVYGQSIAMEIGGESSTNMELEPLAEVNMQPSPNMKVEASLDVEMDLSPDVKVRSSPIIQMEPSPKSNKRMCTILAKRIRACLCLNQHGDKDLNNFLLDKVLSYKHI
jgi:hypothetical protein